jgi:hypothetical protein
MPRKPSTTFLPRDGSTTKTALKTPSTTSSRAIRGRDKFADATLKNLWRPPRRAQSVPASHATGVKLQHMITKSVGICSSLTPAAIPATNYGSERAPRPCVIFRKITNGFRIERSARPIFFAEEAGRAQQNPTNHKSQKFFTALQ